MSKTTIAKAAAIVLIIGAGAYFVLHAHSSGPLNIGDREPELSVAAFPSGSLDLKSYRGKVVILNLWATWCPPCVDETPSLVQFAQKMQDRGVAVVSLSVDDNQTALQSFIDKYHIDYPVGRDPDRSLSAHLGTVQFPESYIFDRRGRLAEKVIGAIDWSDPRIQTFVLDLAGQSNP
jgi:cytochrome c biogenesis protein CcmG, thiol:disulfide interchange protein DsbE